MRTKWLLIGLLAVGVEVSAQELAPDAVPEKLESQSKGGSLGAQLVETFRPPSLSKARAPRYPERERVESNEGWVQLTMMVSPEGQPYDLAVAKSSGSSKFERAALVAAKNWHFDPARLDDAAIDAGTSIKVTFELSGEGRASKRFVLDYQRVNKAIATGDRTKAESILRAIRNLSPNLYEQAFLGVVDFYFSKQWGSEEEQYDALVRAAYFDRDREFLEANALTDLMMTKMSLELKLNLLGEARRTGEQLGARDLADDQREVVNMLLGIIEETARGDGYIEVTGAMESDYRHYHRLLKQKFVYTEVQGAIAELRLHCDSGYVGFKFEEGLEYSVSKDLRRCAVTAIGDPETTFKLTEF